MYIGTVENNKPLDVPAMNLAIYIMRELCAIPIIIHAVKSGTDDISITFFLPKISVSFPAITAPRSVPGNRMTAIQDAVALVI